MGCGASKALAAAPPQGDAPTKQLDVPTEQLMLHAQTHMQLLAQPQPEQVEAGDGPVPVRFVSLTKLKAHGRLPRFGSVQDFVHPVTSEPNANLCELRETFDPAKTCFVFISHRWDRPGVGSRGHPDNTDNHKCQLIVTGLERMRGTHNEVIPADMEVAVWVDFCCIDQDGAPASELNNLGNLIHGCDLFFTPVIDPDHESWAAHGELIGTEIFDGYGAAGWKEYWGRGWCRVEAMLAAVKPRLDGRGTLFRGALGNRRPHVIFGTRELMGLGGPDFLPPLLNASFQRYAPEKGQLTKESDREAIRHLTNEVRADVKEVVACWVDEYQGKGAGTGRRVYDDGSVREGEWVDSVEHGSGSMLLADGATYEGEWKDGKREGRGTVVFASGSIYGGQWKDGKMHGQGRYVLANGDVLHDGEWPRVLHWKPQINKVAMCGALQ